MWHEQQNALAQALLDPALDVPGFVVKTDGKVSDKRLNVYRNNVMVSLTEAMLDSYPVITQLVGDEFAKAMARVYVGIHRPSSPVLLEYGGDYGDFIDQFEPAGSLPYLADVARLEWAWLKAYHGHDAAPLTIEALAAYEEDELGDLQIMLLPSVHLLSSNHPVGSIWSAHQDEDSPSLEKVEAVSEHVLIARPQWDVEVRVISRSLHGFLVSLQSGQTLKRSIDKGATYHGFDAAQAISSLFELNIVSSVFHDPKPSMNEESP